MITCFLESVNCCNHNRKSHSVKEIIQSLEKLQLNIFSVFSHIFGPCQFSRGVLGWMDWRQIRTAVIGVLVKIRIPQNTRISFFCWLYLVTQEHLSLFYRHVKIWIVPVLVEKVIIEGFWFPAWDFVYTSFLFSCS